MRSFTSRVRDGARSLPLTDLHRLPGDRPDIETLLEPGELITAVELPALPLAARSTYRKVRDRASYAFALVSVAAALEVEDGRIKDVRLALGGVAHKPWRAWRGRGGAARPAGNRGRVRAAAEAELADARPLKDNGFKIELARADYRRGARRARGRRGMTIIENAKQLVQGVVQAGMAKAVALAPDSWVPGGTPDPLIRHQHGHIGKPLSRIDGPVKVPARRPSRPSSRSRAWSTPRSPTARSRRAASSSIDTEAAEAAPGVVAVMTHRNAPRLKPPPRHASTASKAAGGDDLPVMQDDRIRWNGEPIAVVLAETQEQADHANSLIRATYEAEEALTDFAAGQGEGHAQGLLWASRCTTKSAMRRQRWRPRRSRSTRPIARRDTTTTRSSSTPSPSLGRANAAHSRRLAAGRAYRLVDRADVRHRRGASGVTSPFVGGGFGGNALWQHQVLAAAAAKIAGRPVRLVLSREGVYRIVGGRAPPNSGSR